MAELLEEVEQEHFVHWLEAKGFKFSAIPNSTYTKSWRQKAKNKRTGLRPGLPDLLIIVRDRLVFIEMKRRKGGVVSPEQRDWLEELNKCAEVNAHIAKGADDAIRIISTYEYLL